MKYIKFLLLIIVFIFISCEKHHETEKIVHTILNSNFENIDSVFQSNERNTSFYLDSVLKGNKPSYYFQGVSDVFNRDFSIVDRDDVLLNRFFYTKDSYGNVFISAINTDASDYIVFTFNKDKNNIWQLVYIEIQSI